MASALFTQDAPAALGPYSQAVKISAASEVIFVSGQIPLTPNGELVSGTIAQELATALSNVQAILREAGATLENVVKSTIFLSDMEDFSEANEEYLRWFKWDLKPARSCVAVKQLPKNARVEVECIARV
ncbi:hypothetical protein Plec18167_008563 [Paecilomyces lecythidis]|uniref:Uncharacterized protein n=1 Tax=Paecilomyces lecythidis TaxID=3004212 RepID=A0ABR3WVF8_9EURO